MSVSCAGAGITLMLLASILIPMITNERVSTIDMEKMNLNTPFVSTNADPVFHEEAIAWKTLSELIFDFE